MTDDLRRSPAHTLHGAMARASGDSVRLQEDDFATQLAVRARPGSASAACVSARLGAELPTAVGEVVEGALPSGEGDVRVLWIGPDEFLAVLPELPHPHRFAEALTRELADAERPRGHVVDVSANRAILRLSGPRARDVLETGVDVDLHDRYFPVGTAISTLLAGAGVLLWRVGTNEWRVLPRASFTRHLVAWLMDAMGEY